MKSAIVTNEDLCRFLEEIKKTIVHEMRGAALTLPREDVRPVGPHDLDAEQVVLSALLCGHITRDALMPLEARHLYSDFNQRLFAVLDMTDERDLRVVVDLLDMKGPVIDELRVIADYTPFAAATTLRKHVATITERWLERELIRTMQEIDAQLRVGAITHAGARARLREHFVGNSA